MGTGFHCARLGSSAGMRSFKTNGPVPVTRTSAGSAVAHTECGIPPA